MTKIIEIHTITPVGPNCLNRGEDGSPKTTVFGGVNRQYVSSQSLKYAIRKDFSSLWRSLRTKYYADAIIQYVKMGNDADVDAYNFVAAFFLSAGDKAMGKTLKAFSVKNFERISAFINDNRESLQIVIAANTKAIDSETGRLDISKMKLPKFSDDFEKVTKKTYQEILMDPKSIPVDTSLFGRMMAEDKNLNVEAACQVAPAISVGKFNAEYDFFTAVDDLKPGDDAGAGHLGEVKYGTSTLYRYLNLDVEKLAENMAASTNNELVGEVISHLIKSAVVTLPSGKQNSFAAKALPVHIHIVVRESHPFNAAEAFEVPVVTSQQAIESLEKALADKAKMYGFDTQNFIIGSGSELTLDEAVSQVVEAIQ